MDIEFCEDFVFRPLNFVKSVFSCIEFYEESKNKLYFPPRQTHANYVKSEIRVHIKTIMVSYDTSF